MLSGEHCWSSPFLELQVRGKSELIWFTQTKSSRAILDFLCIQPHNIPVVQERTKPSTISGYSVASKSISFSSQAGEGAQQRVPHGALPMAGRAGRDHLSKYIIHNLVKIFLLLQILPNTQSPCHCPISWNSYFNGISLDIARGKQWKADFQLNLHLAEHQASKYKSKPDTLAASLTCAVTVPKRGPDTETSWFCKEFHYLLTTKHILHVLSSANNRVMMLKIR